MTAKRIEAVLRPASLALIGASATPGTLGELLCRNVREAGFAGPVYLVNPRHARIDGASVHPSVEDLPDAPDLAVILTPALTVPQILTACGERGIRGALIVSAGFREGGAAGLAHERATVEAARRYGIRFLGPNSVGIVRTDTRLNAAC